MRSYIIGRDCLIAGSVAGNQPDKQSTAIKKQSGAVGSHWISSCARLSVYLDNFLLWLLRLSLLQL